MIISVKAKQENVEKAIQHTTIKNKNNPKYKLH